MSKNMQNIDKYVLEVGKYRRMFKKKKIPTKKSENKKKHSQKTLNMSKNH